MENQIISKKRKLYYINSKVAHKNISGMKLTIASQTKEKEAKGSGIALLQKYVPTLERSRMLSIVRGKGYLIGINVFFYNKVQKKKEK